MVDLKHKTVEGRNLSVFSALIIVFLFAGGKVTEAKSVKVMLLNIEFTNTSALIVFAWILLFWFAYKYWILDKGDWKFDYYTDIIEVCGNSFFTGYAKWVTEERIKTIGDLDKVNSVRLVHDKSYQFRVSYKLQDVLAKNNIYNKGRDTHAVFELKNNFNDILFLIIAQLATILNKPTLTTVFMPYVLFVCAIASGIVHYCWL